MSSKSLRAMGPVLATAVLVTAGLFMFWPAGQARKVEPVKVASMSDGSKACGVRRFGQRLALADAKIQYRGVVRDGVAPEGTELVIGSCSGLTPTEPVLPLVSASGLRAGKWQLPLTLTPAQEGRALASAVLEDLHVSEVALFAPIGGPWHNAASEFKAAFGAAGGRVSTEASPDDPITAITSDAHQGLVVFAGLNEGRRFLQALDRSSWTPELAAAVASPMLNERLVGSAPGYIQAGLIYAVGGIEQHSTLLADYLKALESHATGEPSLAGFTGYVEGRLARETVEAVLQRDDRSITRALRERSWINSRTLNEAFPGVIDSGPAIALFQVPPSIDSMNLMGMAMPTTHHHMPHMKHMDMDSKSDWIWTRATAFRHQSAK